MFKNTFQSGFLSILYSIGSKPLQIWDKKVRNGHIKRITDPDIQSFVLEIVGTNVSTTYITCPADPRLVFLEDCQLRSTLRATHINSFLFVEKRWESSFPTWS